MTFNQYKVKLRSQVTKTVVAFDVTPEITETRNVEYTTLSPVHMPGGIHVYKGTNSRIYNINNIRLVSRTREEAAKNLYRLNILRAWAMPYFGLKNTRLVGAPPDVLALSAYSTGLQDSAHASGRGDSEDSIIGDGSDPNYLRRNRPTNIHNIPCVMQQISIPYPSDVDYIDTMGIEINGTEIKAGVPFPTLMTVDMVLMETHSPNEFANFDLKAYRNGLLDNF